MLDLILQTCLNSLYAASYISLIAVGLVLIFGVMKIINFAHGELYMAGAYCVAVFYGKLQMPFIFSIAAGLIFVGALGLLMERTMFRPLKENPLAGLVASIGFLLILQALAVFLFGVRSTYIPTVTQNIIIFSDNLRLPLARVYVILGAITFLSLLWYFLKKTKFGWALRASAQDPEAAALQGISINQTAKIAMFIGAGLAGVAGALTAPLVAVNPLMGHSVIIMAFIVIIVGGIGSMEGALIASIIYAVVHTFVTTFYDGVLADIVGLGLMCLMLTIKPTGLFGGTERA